MLSNPIEYARIHRKIIESTVQHAPDTVAKSAINLYPAWYQDASYERGNIVRDTDNELYRAIHPMVPAENRRPSEDTFNQKWQKIGDPDEEYPMWTDPLGIPDNGYVLGDKVTYNDRHFVCDAVGGDGKNMWTPGQYGWSLIS